jgi:thiol-disulfide isomerase/thioredoxin
MQKILFVLLAALLICNCKTSIVFNQIKFDENSGSDILFGYAKPNVFEEEPFNSWYNFEKQAYQTDTATIEKIKSMDLSKIEICIVMATWCSDSQREVPRFIKIMELIGYEPHNLKIICVDRKKQAEKTPVEKLLIEKVPTFIFVKNKKEIGRIIEIPNESLEKDMLKIIEAEPSY